MLNNWRTDPCFPINLLYRCKSTRTLRSMSNELVVVLASNCKTNGERLFLFVHLNYEVAYVIACKSDPLLKKKNT